MNIDTILRIAAKEDFIVHKFKWRNSGTRQMCRRLEKDGDLIKVSENSTTRTYRKGLK